MSKKHKKREAERRSFEAERAEPAEAPRAIDLSAPDALERWARYFGTTADEIRLAVNAVGPNAIAVELYLTAPRTDQSAPITPPA